MLIEELIEAEAWPDPDLLEAILDKGDEAVHPLTEIVRQEARSWAEEEVLIKASLLLGGLGARSAIPDLIQLFYRYDSDLLEDVSRALGMLGPEVVDPALEIVQDRSLPWYPWAMGSETAIEAAGQNETLRSQVAQVLRELLADYVARADELTADEIQRATSLVMDLAHLTDPEARELIDQAFEEDIVETWVIDRQNVSQAYTEAKVISGPNFADWLEGYRRQYRDQMRNRKREEREEESRARAATPKEHPELGRNDPCWCGSGRKYKHCHLRQDQGRT